MEITMPGYYTSFRCLAGKCPDSCCKEWDVDVDDASAVMYRALPGELGDRLRSSLKDTEYGVQMQAQDGRCPMWRKDGLCRIQAELGENALCDVCRNFPRISHDYGNFRELGLELSCPEAARLILTCENDSVIAFEEDGGGAPDYDLNDMKILKESRAQALSLLQSKSTKDALMLLLLNAQTVQSCLDGAVMLSTDALMHSSDDTAPGKPMQHTFLSFFKNLEILTPRWRQRLDNPISPYFPKEMTALIRYLTERYWLQAISDYDIAGRIKFIVASCLIVAYLPGSFIENAQLFSKEIENDADNVDAILDAVQSEQCFSNESLLGMLRQCTQEPVTECKGAAYENHAPVRSPFGEKAE